MNPSIYGKKVKELKTSYGHIWIQKIPINAGMEYKNGKIVAPKIREIGFYNHAIYSNIEGATMYEISCINDFYTR